jgi:5-methylcytosine-specific restriction endonuclease McrA
MNDFYHVTAMEIDHIDYIGMYASFELGLLSPSEINELTAMVSPLKVAKCGTCGETKPLSEFHKHSARTTGTDYKCKSCKLSYQRTAKGRDVFRFSNAKRQAHKKQLPVSLSTQEWNAILEHYGHCCAYCGKPESEAGTLAQEHVYPLSRGGGYTVTNIVPACKTCNSRKRNRTPEEAGMTLCRMPLSQLSMFDERI